VSALIRPFADQDLDEIIELSLSAWEPVFISFERIMGPEVFAIQYPDWRKSQAEVVANACQDRDKYRTLVAETAGRVVGFLVYELRESDDTGEVYLLAVHPEYQNRGIGTQLNVAALEVMKAAGMRVAVVGTGGDESHSPARRSYEKAGYTPFPLVRYYKAL
jgi:ribosomal protein S18 acetylase RimI-like enzyme